MSSNIKTVLIFIDWYYPAFKAGGPITSIVNLVKLLKDQYRFYIVTGDMDLGSDKKLTGISTNQWVGGKDGEKILYIKDAQLTKKMFNTIIEETNPNILFLNSLFSKNFSLQPLYYAKNSNLKITLSPRGMLHPQAVSQKSLKKRVFIALLKKSNAFKKVIFLATNKSEEQYIQNHGFKNQIAIVPNIPDLTHINSPSKTLFKPEIIIVSRIAEEKNSLFALETLHHLKTDVAVHWIGEGKSTSYTHLFNSKAKALPSNITFNHHGSLSKGQIHKYLNASSFFFLPTLGENFGHAIFEALSAGCPSVIGENTPFREIEKHKAGYIANLNSSKITSQILDKLIQEPQERLGKMSINAKLFAAKIGNIDQAMDAYQDIW